MQIVPKFRARFMRGRVGLDLPDAYHKFCALNFKDGDRLEVVVKKLKKPRSTGAPGEKGNQNGWLHGIIIPMAAEDRGYLPDELKEEYIAAFAPKKQVRGLDGKVHLRPKRTHEMDTNEMAEFCERIRQCEAERGFIIPDPQKVSVDWN